MDKMVKSLEVKSHADGKVYQINLFEPYRIVEEINHEYPNRSTRYVVNIGCGDGRSKNDPVYPLFKNGYAGLAVEAEENKALYANLPSADIHKCTNLFVTPYNIREILDVYNCPRECDFFKIDIDSYDGVILKNVLDLGYLPKVLQVEVNPEFPPPVSFCVLYDDNYRLHDKDGKIGGFYGSSLSYVINLCSQYNYRLAQIDFVTQWTHDVTLVHNDYLSFLENRLGKKLLTRKVSDLFLSHPPGWSHFKEYGIDKRV